jgi:hypothetical protein
MKILILHPSQHQQPVATALAWEVARDLPPQIRDMPILTKVVSANAPDAIASALAADMVLAVFSLKSGAFAPTVPCYRAVRNTKVAFVAVLTGPVDASRVRKSAWGIKKQFCGNTVVGGYLCQADDDQVWGPAESEVAKVRAFARRCCAEQAGLASEGSRRPTASAELELDRCNRTVLGRQLLAQQ